ncbi:NOP5/NOP56 family protein [Methanonatronarchaeum sp. AMET6-2]|uniref:NOP5/NOP56 family protein n=1 Tax=Methanonatronarchaeum sp. AMET6-2 TaxID=2933293 RepID=UPI001FF51B87|nr:NOP5/NOP56 family protein [Methanonatronarchaeum sp. AMET6-2]UOY09638.1 NOP58 family protein [Methanonatronarchaeum sp. AMET6-2]
MYFIETWYGVFIVDIDGSVVDSQLYPEDTEEIIKENKSESRLPQKYDAQPAPTKTRWKFRHKHWSEYEKQYREHLSSVARELSKEKAGKNLEERGEDVIRAVETMDKIDKSINLLGEAIKEWAYAHQASQLDSGEEIAEAIKKKQIDPDRFKDPETYRQIKQTSTRLCELKETREEIKNYIKSEMRGFAPNISKVCGEILGARLISHAGGLKKLALMPSGTIQVLGAEKALFRHLNEGSEPPKHGVIFQHKLIKNTHYSNRGKIARTLASKTALASRIDYFSGEDKSNKLINDLKKRHKEVTQK